MFFSLPSSEMSSPELLGQFCSLRLSWGSGSFCFVLPFLVFLICMVETGLHYHDHVPVFRRRKARNRGQAISFSK